MIKKLLLILLPVLAFLAGSAGGAMLKGGADPAADAATGEMTQGDGESAEAKEDGGSEHADAPAAAEDHGAAPKEASASEHGEAGNGESGMIGWFGFPNQFFVPVVRNGRTNFIMILTLSLQTTPGTESAIAAQEHRLRDAMLRRLLIHANTGGFDGNFTSEAQQRVLRDALLTAAQDIGGTDIKEVLIEAIVRQEG